MSQLKPSARSAEVRNSTGPLLRIWRQATQNGQPQGGWEMLGLTCNADALPNARPMLTMAMIQEAFHLTPWATARTEVEPVGNVTLVGLDTFYRVEWSAGGFEPGEVEPIDPGRMLGYRVDIRPKLKGLMYHFGDDSEFGPTPSVGGRWPDGPIRHQYRRTGAYPVNVAVSWGADFRIDGGEWAEVPDGERGWSGHPGAGQGGPSGPGAALTTLDGRDSVVIRAGNPPIEA